MTNIETDRSKTRRDYQWKAREGKRKDEPNREPKGTPTLHRRRARRRG